MYKYIYLEYLDSYIPNFERKMFKNYGDSLSGYVCVCLCVCLSHYCAYQNSIKSKGDRRRWQPEGSFFNSYNTKV